MSMEEQRERLSQATLLAWLNRDMQLTDMVTVYLVDSAADHNRGVYCALVPTAKVDGSLGGPSWDLHHGQGIPGSVEYYQGNEKRVEYLRYGDDHGIEPLVIDRCFHGICPDYREISEEFRLFHELYHDRKLDQYLKIGEGGNEQVVGVVERNVIRIRLKEIRQFLAIKEMCLAIQFDCIEYSAYGLDELEIEEGGSDHRGELICWGLHYGQGRNLGNHRAFSRLLGKRFIAPLPKEKSGFWGFAAQEPKRHADFIIGIGENGDEITHTSDPNALANYFGANPGAPHYLTPVYFDKAVLDKYYQQARKYSVEDAILRCGSLWSMYIDNHHDDKVCAWLGDLGRDLSYEEQLHWRAYNVPPSGGMSETFYRRQILAQFTDSDRPEHLFQARYRGLAKTSEQYLGWQLLLPLDPKDEHHLKRVRIPATDEQQDFDELVLGLTKILIDSLNEKQLGHLISADQRKDLKGSISCLEAALIARGVLDADDHIAFLRRLQKLRSSSSAHRKGSNYRKIAAEFGVDNQNLRSVFTGILQRALTLLDYLTGVVCSGKLCSPGK